MAKRHAPTKPDRQLELDSAPTERASAISGRPPVILQLGPRDFSLLAWVRDEEGEPVYRVAKDRIKAASTAGVLGRKLRSKGER